MTPSFAALSVRIAEAMAADATRLQRRLVRAQSTHAPAAAWTRIGEDLERTIVRRNARAANKPALAFPSELPVSQRADEIAQAIREHQVVIVCGETGSGKTTQLPKICLAAGRGERGAIGHTQPRRIAA
nr:Flp pilus assembly complex ATPase component TadA [Betaproteobacteria bacterium]